MRRNHVASTLIRRHFGTKCPLGCFFFVSDTCTEQPIDLVFVLDASHSIWIPDFKKELKFVNDVLTSFDVKTGFNQTHVGVVTFGHGVWPQFYLDSYKSMTALFFLFLLLCNLINF